MKTIKELTEEIQGYERATVSNIFSIGKSLIDLQSLCKQAQIEFKEHCEMEFTFSINHAYKFIAVYKKFSKPLPGESPFSIGIKKLYLLTQIDDEEKLDEFVEIAKEPKMTAQKLEKKIKRSLPKVGDESYYAKNLDTKDKQEDRKLKLIRLAKELESEFKSFLAIKENLRLKANNWLNNAVNLPDLAEAVKEIKEQLRYLE